MITVKSISRSLPSRVNEDAFKTEEKDNSLIAVVTDGMGGLYAGNIASRLVSDTICSAIIESREENPEDSLQEAFKEADAALREESRKIHCRMGAAVTAIFVSENTCYSAWQGNVRLYLKRNASVIQLTEDHTVDVGYGKKCLTRCLKGCGLREDLPCISTNIQSGDALFLCTDGFYEKHESLLKSLGKEDFEKEINSLIPDDDLTVVAIWV